MHVTSNELGKSMSGVSMAKHGVPGSHRVAWHYLGIKSGLCKCHI
jgi:hypothetical protein